LENLHQLQDRLGKGFYVDNFYEMASLCKSLALGSTSPVPFFVMQHVFLGIAKNWEDRPLPVEEAKLVENKMMEPLIHLVKAISLNASNETIYNILDNIVATYLTA